MNLLERYLKIPEVSASDAYTSTMQLNLDSDQIDKINEKIASVEDDIPSSTEDLFSKFSRFSQRGILEIAKEFPKGKINIAVLYRIIYRRLRWCTYTKCISRKIKNLSRKSRQSPRFTLIFLKS